MPYIVKDINKGGIASVNNLISANGVLFFTAYDTGYAHGEELWRSDGTAAGTYLVKDINPGGGSSEITGMTNVNGTLYFRATDASGIRRLWKSDGTEQGTIAVSTEVSANGYITNVGSTIYFMGNTSTYGTELWKTDGTAGGTMMVKDINPGSGSPFVSELANINGTLYLRAAFNNTVQLWKSDGTDQGTVLVTQINSPWADIRQFTNFNGTLFLIIDDTIHGRELWKSDGTEQGTVMVKDINPGLDDAYISGMLIMKDTLYFSAITNATGRELWKSDGTEAGTKMIIDLNPGDGSSYLDFIINVNDTLYFVEDDGVHGRELWKTDGTAAGTELVKDIYPGSWGSSILNILNVNGTIYFAANTGSGGPELWKSDGTEAGTVLVRNIAPSDDYQYIDFMTNVNGRLYFMCSTAVDGTAYKSTLWSVGTCTPANTGINTIEKTTPYNSQVQSSSNTTCYCNVFNELIATVESSGEAPVNGNISVKEWLYPPLDGNYVRRQYELYPETDTDNATAKVTLYYTQSDFNEYNSYDYTANSLKLPVDSSDIKGIRSIRIEKHGGTSSNDTGWPITYPGAMTEINPDDADIVWNSTAKRWEVNFETTGMGGYIIRTLELTDPTAVSVSDTAICSGPDITLSATCAQGTLNWYASASGGSSIGTSSPLILSPTVTTTYYAACEYGLNSTNRIATSEVVVTTMPTSPENISIDKTDICSGTNVELTATCPIGSVKWYTLASGGSAFSTASSLQVSPPYNTSYYVACENGDCKTDRVWVGDVVVTDQPDNPTSVSIDQTNVCSNNYVGFSASCDYGTATWYKGEYDLTSIATGNWGEVPGITTSYYVACENGDCKSERISAGTVTVTEQPIDPTDVSVSLTSICSGTDITLSAYCSIGEVAWYKIGQDEDIFLETGSIITQTPLVTTKYYAMCINGICESSRVITEQVVVTTMPSKPTGVSVDKTAVCSGTSIILSATCDIGTITWYNDSIGDTSIGTGNNLQLTPTDTYTYYATCFNGDCETNMVATDMVTVTTQPTNPVNVASYKSAVCSGEPASLSASCAVSEPVWYNSATAATASGTGDYFDPTPASTTRYYVACENGSCKSERVATEEVTVRPTPTKPTNLSQWDTKTCGEMSIDLSGSCATGTLKWYDSATAITPAYEGSVVYAYVTKTTTYYAACETTYCSSERVAMEEIVFYARPQDPTGITVSKTAICNGDSVSLSATCSIGEVKWIRAYTAAGVEQYDLVPTHTPTENSIYYAYCMNGPCISSYLPTEAVVVTEQPTIPTDLFQGGTQVCIGTGIYMTASCAIGTQTWYDSSTGGAVLATGDYFAPQPTTTTTYYVACENGNCKSARVAMNQIVVYQQPVNPTGVAVSKTAICNGETITLSGSCLIGTLRWYKTSMDPDTAFTYKPKVNTTYHAFCSNVECSSGIVATAEVVVTQQPVNPTNVGVSSTDICKGDSITLTANCTVGTVTWYTSTTGTVVVGTGDNLSQSPSVATKYYAACVNGICNSGRVATSEVTVKAKPVTPVISGRNAICAGESVTLMASAPANHPDATFHWSGGSVGISLTTSPATITNYRTVASYNGCNSDSSAVFTVSVGRVPDQPAITADNATICKGSAVILTGQCLSTTDSFYWSGSAITNTNSLQGTFYKNTRQITEPGTYKGWCESNTGCKGAERSITINPGNNCNGKNFITITPAKPVVCPGASVTLTAAGCTGTVSWLGGVSTQTGTSISVKPTANTTYFIQCSAGGSATVDVTVVTSAVVMSANITTGNELIKAVNSIESNKKIGDPDFSPAPIVTFEAGKSILLKPGFVADAKTVFTAQIKGCN
ncbi:ELWxxDGT repeat protein [Emticicia sp. C21]|uniref:ELWxxDGT repeat protein n=1 Tax=Emticicia sp. C21 TaxID=2302915 RepID=UPI0013145549|nr:ELWxxDGT repeat protein [Emticicia sp. C21]